MSEDKVITIKVKLPKNKDMVERLTAFSQKLATRSSDDLFIALFNEGCELMGYGDKDGAAVFDIPDRIFILWKSYAPPIANYVLHFLKKEVDQRIANLLESK